ncbi:multidrug effflux MFS transporter [Roseisolibacter sp. H3M3-2]|uniref:multidrug effflux MFS transporter n=1 Tax=Roseisolibacter sp. H3M3-2 TaxID=3031323 RepID=UPI0023DA1C0E|nr:multidrug effflux MFS transporter [Roseisolibacter sp. H3M3-2]MDF1502533.1 multidrug effflux MFS transporter [Roseisolibacter sp. H3M3-2]
MTRLRPHGVGFTLLLGSLVTLAAFSTDMGLPVLAETGASLGVPASTAALTLSVFMAGFALGPLLFGPVSDRVGRRPVMLAAVATFAGFGALGAFAGSLPALLAWRFLMGAAAGACQVLVLATVRDRFSGAEARARQSYVNLAAGVAPIVAPTLGVWVAAAGGWRGIYGVLAAGGLVLLAAAARHFDESAPRAAAALTVRGTLANYARVLRHPVSLGHSLVVALGFGALFAYVSGSSLVLIGLMGVPRGTYGLLFALPSLGLMAGAFVNARLARRGAAPATLIGAGLAAQGAVALVLLALAASRALGPLALVGLLVVNNLAQGVVRPNAAQGALEPTPDIAGTASAVLTGLQMLVGAGASALAAALFDGRTAVAMTGTMAVCIAAAAAVHAFVVRPAERRLSRAAPGGPAAAAVARAA